MAFDPLWLEPGLHYDLHCEHRRGVEGAGAFTNGGPKLVWHITVSPWRAVDAMVDTVVARRVAPHFVIGGRRGTKLPVVVQLLPLNVAGRSLAHTLGPETNRANVIQVEICAEPDAASAAAHKAPKQDVVANWPDERYAALANLATLIKHRVDIPTSLARSFQNTHRFSGTGFVVVSGHCGHMHVPGNDHSDPTKDFQGGKLIGFMRTAPNNL